MTLWHAVLLLIAIVSISIVTYWVLYTTRLHPNKRTMALKGRLPYSKEEGIAIATQEKERTGHTGSIS